MKDCDCETRQPTAFDLWVYRQADRFLFQPILIPIILAFTNAINWLIDRLTTHDNPHP